MHPLAIKARGGTEHIEGEREDRREKERGGIEENRREKKEKLRDKERGEWTNHNQKAGWRRSKYREAEAASSADHRQSFSSLPPAASTWSHCREVGTPLTGGTKNKGRRQRSEAEERRRRINVFHTADCRNTNATVRHQHRKRQRLHSR